MKNDPQARARRGSRPGARAWLLTQLVIARVRLGQSVSVRKLEAAAVRAGYSEFEFLSSLSRHVDAGLLAPDDLYAPEPTVVITLAGINRILQVRQAHAERGR